MPHRPGTPGAASGKHHGWRLKQPGSCLLLTPYCLLPISYAVFLFWVKMVNIFGGDKCMIDVDRWRDRFPTQNLEHNIC